MKKVLFKSALEALVLSIVFVMLNLFVTRIELFFTVAFFIVFALIGFMLFISIETCSLNEDKSFAYPVALMIEGLLLIEATGIILSCWKTQTESTFILIVWNVLFISMFVTTFIGTREEKNNT